MENRLSHVQDLDQVAVFPFIILYDLVKQIELRLLIGL